MCDGRYVCSQASHTRSLTRRRFRPQWVSSVAAQFGTDDPEILEPVVKVATPFTWSRIERHPTSPARARPGRTARMSRCFQPGGVKALLEAAAQVKLECSTKISSSDLILRTPQGPAAGRTVGVEVISRDAPQPGVFLKGEVVPPATARIPSRAKSLGERHRLCNRAPVLRPRCIGVTERAMRTYVRPSSRTEQEHWGARIRTWIVGGQSERASQLPHSPPGSTEGITERRLSGACAGSARGLLRCPFRGLGRLGGLFRGRALPSVRVRGVRGRRWRRRRGL